MYREMDWTRDHCDQGDKPNPERQDSLSYVEFMCGEHRQVGVWGYRGEGQERVTGMNVIKGLLPVINLSWENSLPCALNTCSSKSFHTLRGTAIGESTLENALAAWCKHEHMMKTLWPSSFCARKMSSINEHICQPKNITTNPAVLLIIAHNKKELNYPRTAKW